MKLTFKPAIIALSLVLLLPGLASANDINAKALELAGQQKFSQALTLLSQQDVKLQSGYEHRFLKARILSWDGQYKKAEKELDSLTAQYPDNPDLQLTKGNLEYYQGNLSSAESYYQTVLDKFPDYMDARKGLENVRKARTEQIVNKKYRWRIDGGLGFSSFDQDNLASWDNQYLRAEYAQGALAYHASAQRYNRFDTTNIEIKAGLSDAVRGGWDWGVEVGLTPDALFRPDFSAGGRVGRAIEIENGTVLYPNVTYRYDDYAAGAIHNIQPSITTYFENEVELTGRLIGTVQEAENDQLGWLVQGRIPVSNQLRLNIGYANAPEAIDGVVVTTQSLFGGLSYALRDDLELHLNFARDDRENIYIRDSVNVGFTHKR